MATRAQGGAQINTRIGPDAAAALARLRESMTMREAVERGLIGLDGAGNSGQAERGAAHAATASANSDATCTPSTNRGAVTM